MAEQQDIWVVGYDDLPTDGQATSFYYLISVPVKDRVPMFIPPPANPPREPRPPRSPA